MYLSERDQGSDPYNVGKFAKPKARKHFTEDELHIEKGEEQQ
jgi:hypothetical protein